MSVTISIESGVARLALARPEVRNALNDEVMRRIADTLNRLQGDRSVRVLVVTLRARFARVSICRPPSQMCGAP